MNEVDQADQLRSYYTTTRTYKKNWKPLWHFLLDTTVTNVYEIAHCTPKYPYGHTKDRSSHKQFRRQLAVELFAESARSRSAGTRLGTDKTVSDYVRHIYAPDHGKIELLEPGKCLNCVAYVLSKRKVRNGWAKRKLLGELSTNSVRPASQEARKRRDQHPKGFYGCRLCDMYLCRHGGCWEEHINAIHT